MPNQRDLRASDDDRNRIVECLQVAAVEGRLTAEELDGRLESALTARTYGELDTLLVDLPVVDARPAVPSGPAKELVRLESRSGNIRRAGAWSVPLRLGVEVRSGNVFLDFTEAVITHPTLDLTVTMTSGNLRLIVPPDVAVDAADVAIRSGSVREYAHRDPSLPVRLLVTVSGRLRSGNVVVRGPGGLRDRFLRRSSGT